MSTEQWVVKVLCSLEGNHRSGITLAMHHRLCGVSTYRLSGLRKGDEHPAYTPVGVWQSLFLGHIAALARCGLLLWTE